MRFIQVTGEKGSILVWPPNVTIASEVGGTGCAMLVAGNEDMFIVSESFDEVKMKLAREGWLSPKQLT